MIPRHQTVLFVILLLASVIMGAVLWNQLRRAHERLLRSEDAAPTQAPLIAPAEQATLMVANDADNSVQPRILTLPLPQNPEARARAVLGKLFDLVRCTRCRASGSRRRQLHRASVSYAHRRRTAEKPRPMRPSLPW